MPKNHKCICDASQNQAEAYCRPADVMVHTSRCDSTYCHSKGHMKILIVYKWKKLSVITSKGIIPALQLKVYQG